MPKRQRSRAPFNGMSFCPNLYLCQSQQIGMPCIQTLSDADRERLEHAGITIVWYDDLEGDRPNVQTEDPLVRRIVQQYMPAQTDIYDVLRARYKPLNQSQRCVGIRRQEGTVILPAGEHIYKGMDFFYTPAQESEYRQRVPDGPTWYGAAETAFQYVKRLGGALHSYICERDIKLLEFTPENVRWCMRQLHRRDEGLAAELLDDMLCPENDPVRCIKKYLRRRRWGDSVWLRRCAEMPACTKSREGRIIWGSTGPDRLVADALAPILRTAGYDGYFYSEHLDPLTATGVQLEQVILLRPGRVLRRDIEDPLDWMRWPESWLRMVPGIGDEAFQPNCDFIYGFHRNENFRMVRFFFDHPVMSKHNLKAVRQLTQLSKASSLIVGTYNVHSFQCINRTLNGQPAMLGVLDLMEACRADIVCLQECDTDVDDFAELCRERKWTVHRSPKQYGLMVIVRPWHRVRSMRFRAFARPRWHTRQAPRGYLSFSCGGLSFACTHLEIGHRYFMEQRLKNADDIGKAARSNCRLRRCQLQGLLKERLDVICGDLNMEPWTPEFKYLTAACTVPDLENTVTTPYSSRVDYIAYVKGGKGRADACYVLDSPFSDHLPVVHAVRAV